MSEQKISVEQLEAGIDEDGEVEDCDVSTFYQRVEYLDVGDGFLRVVSDGPGYNTETRVPFALLEEMGWTRVPAPPEAHDTEH